MNDIIFLFIVFGVISFAIYASIDVWKQTKNFTKIKKND